MSSRTFLVAIVLMAVGGCSRSAEDRPATADTVVSARDDSAGVEADAALSSSSACRYLASLPASLDSVGINAKNLMSQNESCLLPLLDSVVAGVRRNGGDGYLAALDSLCIYTDGDAGEAIGIAVSGLFVDSIPRYLDHLYLAGKGSCLWRQVIGGLRLEYQIGNSPDPNRGSFQEARADLEKRALRSVVDGDMAKKKFVREMLDITFSRESVGERMRDEG